MPLELKKKLEKENIVLLREIFNNFIKTEDFKRIKMVSIWLIFYNLKNI